MLKTFTLALLTTALAGPAAATSHKEDKRGDAHRAPHGPPVHMLRPPPRPERPAPPVDAPPEARPGQCYARLSLPARTERYTEQVVVEPERIETRTIPPVYGKRPKEVVVRPERRRTVTTPAQYETVHEEVLVRPGSEERVVEPPELRTVHERRTVEPGRRGWRLVHSPLQPEPVWCLIEEPAVTETVHRVVVVRPETVRTIIRPPAYRTETRQVMRRPSETREIVIPARKRTVLVDEVVEPAREVERRIPPRYAAVTREREVEPARTDWVAVLCEAEADARRIKAMQAALKRRGFYRGPVDGLYGPNTAEAVRAFQAAERLPHAGYLSLDTLSRLGVPHGATAPDAGPTRLGPSIG